MGTVGLAFGSATSGAGFDVASTVSQILAIQQGIETPWKTQIAHLQAQDAVLTTLGTDLATLTAKVQALTDFSGVLAQKDGASSNTGVVALTSASPSSVAGNHEIVVGRLAQTSSVYAEPVAANAVLSGSISIQLGSGAPVSVAVDPVNSTLAGLAASINGAGVGARASVVQDAQGSRLVLVSATSGSGGQLTVTSALHNETSGNDVATQVGHAGQDAQLTVDGIAVVSASNTVSGAIPGVTFQLLNTSASAVQVQITNDTAAVASAVNDFVAAYNAVIKDVSAQEKNDATGKAQPLYGDPTLALLQTQLSAALLRGGGGSGVDPLSLLGISLAKDGTLTLSASTLTTNIGGKFAEIVSALQDAGGFGKEFNTTLGQLGGDTPQGAVFLAVQQNTTQEKTLNKSVSDTEKRLAAKKIVLTKELNLANQILQSIPAQIDQVDKIYNALTGYKG